MRESSRAKHNLNIESSAPDTIRPNLSTLSEAPIPSYILHKKVNHSRKYNNAISPTQIFLVSLLSSLWDHGPKKKLWRNKDLRCNFTFILNIVDLWFRKVFIVMLPFKILTLSRDCQPPWTGHEKNKTTTTTK